MIQLVSFVWFLLDCLALFRNTAYFSIFSRNIYHLSACV